MRDHVKGGALTETTFFILLAVFIPNHGYGIMQFIEEQTEGRLVLGAGTLYGAIKTLDKKGWIQAVDEDESSRKKEYVITDLGREVALQELNRLEDLSQVAKKIMKGGSKDE